MIVFAIVKSRMERILKLLRDIDRLGSWASKWGMRSQPVKCDMMQLTNKRSSKIQANYTLEGTVLENVESKKYLGVTITNDFKWNTHISNVCTKANRTLGFLRRNLYSCILVVNFPFLDGDVPRRASYGVYISQPIMFARVCNHVTDFNARNKCLTARLLQQSYRYNKLRKTFSKFHRRHYELNSKYNVGLKTFLGEGLSEPEFYSEKSTSRQRSGKGAIRKRPQLQKPRWEKTKLTIRHLYHENTS